MVFPLHEETVSREEGRQLAKATYHKIHTLKQHLRARKCLDHQFRAMATLAAADAKVLASFAAAKKNKRKDYVPRRIVQVCADLWQQQGGNMWETLQRCVPAA